jgi:phosphate:Na+ symporter
MIPAFLVSCLVLLTASAALGENGETVSWTMNIIGLMGGLAFFLFGMELMSLGMKNAAGNKLRSILATLTGDRFRALILGFVVTLIIQSGGATSVMLVGFVQAGLMAFSQTIGVLIGAGIGKTVTIQLIAFKVTDYSLVFIALGCLMRLVSRKDTVRSVGEVILGFGILFYGLDLMGDSMAPLGKSEAVRSVLGRLANPFIGLAVGTLITAMIQSSTAFIGILIILGTSGVIPSLETMVPMILGANIGTCITAGMASIGTSQEAKRVAVANFLLRVFGVAVFFLFVPQITTFVHGMTGSVSSGIARDIANVHTLFNVSLVMFIPFTTQFAHFIVRIMPDRPIDLARRHTTTFLDEGKILSPALALDLARAEISRMAGVLERMLRAIAVPFVTDEVKKDKEHPEMTLMEGVDNREEELDFLEEKIVSYLIRVAQMAGAADCTQSAYSMISIVKDMESIGDIVHRNVIPLIAKKKALKHDFSLEGKEELTIYHRKVCNQIRLLKESFAERDLEKAKNIMAKERKYLDLELQYRVRHLNRLVCRRMESVETHEIHMELMNLMSQIIVYTSNIAKTFLQTQIEDKKLLL